MTNARDILDSKEMKNVIKAIDALKKKNLSTQYETDRPWPVALALVGRYKPEVVLQLLLNDKQYYPGYKDVLTASFVGWLVAPQMREIRQSLMIQAALTHMNQAEMRAGLADSPLTIEADIAARYLFTGTDFLIEIYDCLGGYYAFANAPSFAGLWGEFESVEKTINTASRAIAFLHHGVDRFSNHGRPFVPSLNKAVLIFDHLKDKNSLFPFKENYVGRSLLHQRWSKNKQTLALMYAASTIRVNRKSLLQIILGGFFSYNDHAPYLENWVGRARYVSNHIFSLMGDPELSRKTSRLLGNGPIINFEAPKLDEYENASFEKAFSNLIR